LAQLLEELKRDRADLDEVVAEQRALDGLYDDLVRWLSEPDGMPLDSVGWGFDSLAYSNRTMYPRQSSWTTMVAAAQLGLLDAPELVAQLGDIYENANQRLVQNSVGYDEHLFTMVREQVTRIWDAENRRLLTTDPLEIARVRGQVSNMHHSWNTWYIAYLLEYGDRLDAAIDQGERYLGAAGDGTRRKPSATR